MANLNKVMLIGNLTRDPEVRYTPKGTAVADLGLAINRYYQGDNGERQEETTFVDVTLWGKQAELAQQYLGKGRPVYIEGRLQMDTWEDKQSGQKRSKIKIVCENMQFLGSRDGGGGGGGGGVVVVVVAHAAVAMKKKVTAAAPHSAKLAVVVAIAAAATVVPARAQRQDLLLKTTTLVMARSPMVSKRTTFRFDLTPAG